MNRGFFYEDYNSDDFILSSIYFVVLYLICDDGIIYIGIYIRRDFLFIYLSNSGIIFIFDLKSEYKFLSLKISL